MNTLILADIPGWFDFDDIYDQVLSELADEKRIHIVECGVFCGKSTIYMATKIKDFQNAHPDARIRFDAIDNWSESAIYGASEATFRHFAMVFGVDQLITIVKNDQFQVAPTYKDNSLDFVFLDSDHSYNGTKRAIQAFLPKLKSGRILAGHDYQHEFPGVIKAVRELLPKAIKDKHSFVWRKP